MVAPVLATKDENQNDSNSSTLTINKPASTVEGDRLFAFLSNETGGFAEESGWDLEYVHNGPDVDIVIYSKIAGASEPSSYTFDMNATENGGWIFRITGADDWHSITVIGPSDEDATLDGIDTVHDDSLVFGLTAGDGNDTVPMTFGGTGWTATPADEIAAGTGNQGVGLAYAERDITSAGTVPDMTITHTTNDGKNSVMVAISPEYTSGAGVTGVISRIGDVAATDPVAQSSYTPDFSGESWIENDLLVVSCYSSNDTPTWSAPDGTWTQRINGASSGGDDRRLTVFTKLAGAAEDETPTFSISSATLGTVVVEIWRGCDTTTPVEAASASASLHTNDNKSRGPALTALTDGAVFVHILGSHTDASTDHGAPTHTTLGAEYQADATYHDRAILTAYLEMPWGGYWQPRQWKHGGGAQQEGATGSLILKPAAGAQTVNVGTLAETDSLVAATPTKAPTVGTVAELDSLVPAAAEKPIVAPVGVLAETDLPVGVAIGQGVPVGTLAEVDALLPIPAEKPIITTVGTLGEVDALVAVSPVKLPTVGTLAEINSLLPIAAVKPILVTIGTLAETDSLLPVAVVQGITVAVGTLAETDLLIPIGIIQGVVVVGTLAELDLLIAIAVDQGIAGTDAELAGWGIPIGL